MNAPQPPAQNQSSGGGNLVLYLFVGYVLLVLLVGIMGCLASLFGKADCSQGAAGYMLFVGGWIFGVVMWLFDGILIRTVIQFGDFVGPSSSIGAVLSEIWKMIRDISNLLLIGALVWVAILIMLQASPRGKKPSSLIIGVIIAALFINFSYFFAATIIDASNFVTTKIYSTLTGSSGRTSEGVFDTIESVGNTLNGASTITDSVMAIVGLTTLYGFSFDKEGVSKIYGEGEGEGFNYSLLLIGLMGSLLMGGLTAVFAKGIYLLVVRFTSVIFLLITSPLAILTFSGIEKLEEWGAQWWKTLIAQSLFPPVFMFLIGIALSIANAGTQRIQGNTLGTGFSEITKPDAYNLNRFDPNPQSPLLEMFLFYFLALGLVYLALSVAESIATETAGKFPDSKFLAQNLSISGLKKGVMKGGEAAAGIMMGMRPMKNFLTKTRHLPITGKPTSVLRLGWKKSLKDKPDGWWKKTKRSVGDVWDPARKDIREKKKSIDEKRINEGRDALGRYINGSPKDGDKELIERMSRNESVFKKMTQNLSSEELEELKYLLPEKLEEIEKAQREAITKGTKSSVASTDQSTKTIEELLGEIKENETAEAIRERLRDEKSATLDGKNAEQIKTILKQIRDKVGGGGSGALGAVLSPQMLMNDRVIADLTDDDFEQIKGKREDISDEQWEEIDRRRETSLKRRGPRQPSPADISEEELPLIPDY